MTTKPWSEIAKPIGEDFEKWWLRNRLTRLPIKALFKQCYEAGRRAQTADNEWEMAKLKAENEQFRRWAKTVTVTYPEDEAEA